MSQEGDQAKAPVPSVVHATAILGFQGISNNTNGELSIQGDNLVFKPAEGPITRIAIGSIQSVFLTQEDKEVGGTPLVGPGSYTIRRGTSDWVIRSQEVRLFDIGLPRFQRRFSRSDLPIE